METLGQLVDIGLHMDKHLEALEGQDGVWVILLVEASSGRAELSVPLAQIREARLWIRNHDGS